MKKQLLTFIFTLTCSVLVAQSVNLKFGADGVMGVPDTASMEEIIELEFYLINEGPDPISQPIEVRFSVDEQRNMYDYEVIATTNNMTAWAVGDSIRFTHSDTVYNPDYRTGDNIIVIWPTATIANTPGTQESYQDETTVIDERSSVSVQETALKSLNVYPNPIADQFNINCDCDFTWELYDFAGRVINKGISKQVQAADLIPGVYLLHVTDTLTEQTQVLKLYKD